MAVDISGIGYFMPIFGFLFIFIIVYALLAKTKLLGDSKAINAIIALVVAIIFAVFASTQEYIRQVTPWFAVLMIVLFFVLIIIGLSQQKIADIMKPWAVWVFIIALILVFLIVAIKVFPDTFGNVWSDIVYFFINNAKIAGAIVLLIIGGIVVWIVTKK